MFSPHLALILHPSLLALVSSILFIVFAIAVLRLHAFLALMLAATLVGILGPGAGFSLAQIVELVMTEFGTATGRIGFSIAIAAVIGAALMASGAADKIVRRFVAVLGEKRAPLALLVSSYILAIPVFFDTVFFLLVPLARALSLRTRGNYALHLLAICGGVITHATVPPTPGPLAAAETMQIDLGFAILVGIVAGILPALGGLAFARWRDRRMPVPLRATGGSSLESVAAMAGKDEAELPGFMVSIAPVVLPLLLIAGASLAATLRGALPPGGIAAIEFLGNKNVALFIGAAIAVAVCLRQKSLGWRDTENIVGEPLMTAGVIILITAAGGAYGTMLRNAGIGDVVRGLAGSESPNFILLSWTLAAILRIAQGSVTVSMITTAGIVMSLVGADGFGVHPVYVFLAIGYGATSLSWMNDSGFWVFSRMSGLTDQETLRSWTPLLTLISLLGLVQILVVAYFFPGVGR
ncbi:MAG: GntP family permease [Verrucomicrobiota bacterium]